MNGFIAEYYLWFKALHIVSVIAWMAGLLYLPRLFVYHADAEIGSEKSETFKVMERRLLRAIMNPAAAATFVFGAMMLWALSPGVWSEGWIYLKLFCIAGLAISHEVMAKAQRRFAADANDKTARYYRVLNEVPTVLMLILVIAVVVKPF
ncbi:MAG: protoporphyrinogen oxidase HemJ [Rhodospirillales bacterium]